MNAIMAGLPRALSIMSLLEFILKIIIYTLNTTKCKQ